MLHRLVCIVFGALILQAPSLLAAGADAVDSAVPLPRHFKSYFEGAAVAGLCSASVIRFTKAIDAPAVILTNGHCFDGDIPEGGFVYNRPTPGKTAAFFSIASGHGAVVHVLSKRLIYATETKTDIALYEVDTTYRKLQKLGIRAFTLARASARPGDRVDMVSEKFEQLQFCTVDNVIHELKEKDFDTLNAYRYKNCESMHGWSGAPLILHGTRKIVGVNNSHFAGGDSCGVENPCEIDKNGRVTFGPEGASYGQQTALILSCVRADGQFSLEVPGCQLRFNF